MKIPILQMEKVSKSFPGVQALDEVSFETYAGEAHALVGANGAGKSTLMNILCGVISADEGQIALEGREVAIEDPLDASQRGIAFCQQETALLPTLSVAENLFINSFPKKYGLLDPRDMEKRSIDTLRKLNCNFHPDTEIHQLSPGDRQMVEIARTLLLDPKVIIFDEPTSSLPNREKNRLFEVICSLKNEDVAIIYITHLLDEIFDICERVTVLRNGKTVESGLLEKYNQREIVRMMIGEHELGDHYEIRQDKFSGQKLLQVENLSRENVLNEISFTLSRGEILGVWGLLGAGRTELARALVGLDRIDTGKVQVFINDKPVTITPKNANKWLGMVTENRREEGLLLPYSVRENMSLANLKSLTSKVWPLINLKREKELTKRFIEKLNIIVTSIEQPVRTLSGGNQQKVVVSRWLERDPAIYIMDEPTKGLDVGAKGEIRKIIRDLANSGKGIILVSSEIDEIMKLSDRFIVMNRGKIVAKMPKSTKKDELMAMAAGVASEVYCED